MKRFALIIFFCASLALLPKAADAGVPQRIISLAPNLTEIIYAMGLGDKIVAVSDYCDRPAGAVLKPKVGGISNPSLEKIVSLKPDIVMMTTDGNTKDANDRLVELGIRTYIFRARKIGELPGELRSMGAVLGAKKEAEQLAKRFETISRRQATPPASTGKAVFVIQPEPLIVAADGNAIQDTFRILGWTNIAKNAGRKYVRFSVEELIQRSPDVILIGMGHPRMMEDAKGFLKKVNTLSAVKSGRVYYVSDALFRLGPRVIDGIEELSRILNKK